ncbi:hypothetical protein RB25_13360 [Herbaspirillum rubrisubalbicans]|uniref:DUF1302 domain-containing protein n=2 Tax=Herbaspirillum rubrisubalbicans TaxID=80842 RepID=A0ABX9C739_9BURK|nr:DUF1302 family protein [Herbaspirillum rubrisubalbicans]MCP1572977.1 hypothetical protein [Herbaspirillum rubrisubalbicans]QJQ01537.1 DUF1302 domain-containing protein [Herbaspirillum rubrisubalbicans Os34]RAM66742.1 hypothetical protein RB24_00055 [Herbaspirillum rubrisubalbicans]RAN47401.1 hypothetical protein RB25_13360 [Herbaspirillum rubrisubalbicans]
MGPQKTERSRRAKSHVALSLAGAFAAGCASSACAAEFDVGNPDIAIRWDTTASYSLGMRMQGRDPIIANSPTYDEGDALFGKHQMTTKRLDILTEFDFVYKQSMGFRVSAAGWFDDAYGSKDKSNPLVTSQGFQPNYNNNEYSSVVKRFYHGPSGEFLDAFVFATIPLGDDMSASFKLGRHAVTWGESLFGSANAIAYSQGPSDGRKQLSNPNASAKETALPVNQISTSVQVASNVSIAGLYTFEFRPDRVPEGGTFYGVDSILLGPDNTVVNRFANVNIGRGTPVYGRKGDVGLALQWRPAILDGTLGFYYRKFDDKTAWTSQLDTTPMLTGGSMVTRPVYARDVKLLGVSLSKSIAGASIGAEVSYRKNGALTQDPASPPGGGAPGSDLDGPRGNTWHALANAIYSLPTLPVWDNAILAVELQYSRLAKVTKHPEQFLAAGYGVTCNIPGNGVAAGCTTKDYWNIGVSFTPAWNQALPGVNLEMPLYYGRGLKGNAPYNQGGYEGFSPYSVGLRAKVFEKYQFDLKYNGYNGKRVNTPTGPQILGSAYLADKGTLTLSFQTTY